MHVDKGCYHNVQGLLKCTYVHTSIAQLLNIHTYNSPSVPELAIILLRNYIGVGVSPVGSILIEPSFREVNEIHNNKTITLQGNMQFASASLYCSAKLACFGACNCCMYNTPLYMQHMHMDIILSCYCAGWLGLA